jgi:riboflavin biosynthesis pyrimidine reductase
VKNHELNLKSFLSFAFKQGWSRIMVEGGARLLSSFLNSHLADELNVYISPKLAMDSSAIQLTGFAKTKANQFIDNYQLDSIERFAPDIYLRFRKNGQNRKDGQE